jgi:translation factor GUF1, mitochondrial
MHPNQYPVGRLFAGQVGYVVCGMRRSNEAHIGDTFYLSGKEVDPLPGFEELKSMVCSLPTVANLGVCWCISFG